MVFSISLLAMSLSLDALGVGISYGLRKIRIPIVPKLIICFFSILYSGAALMLGKSLSMILPSFAAKMTGISILMVMGIWIILQALLKRQDDTHNNSYETREITLFKIVIKSLGITIQVIRDPKEGDIDKSGIIDVKEALLLGLALSVDAIGVGIGSAMAGFNSYFIPFAVGLFQLGFLYAGTYLGIKFSLIGNMNKKLLSLLPGILLIVIAVIRIY